MRKTLPDAQDYLLGALAALIALLLRHLLSPLLGMENPYLTAWAAVVFSAWYCGMGPSIVCTLLSVFGVWYWFLPYFNSFTFQNPETEISGMVLFSALSGLVIALGEANRQSKVRSVREVEERRRIEADLRTAQAELESRVQERTGELSLANQSLSHEAAKVRAQAEWLDAANDAIFVGGSDERITYWNKGAERLYGWSRAEAVGRSPHELLRTEFPVPFADVAGQRQRGGWQGELVHTKRDGMQVAVASQWTTLKDPHDHVTGWIEINRDITDRKAAEAARQFTARLLKMQDEERRRIARDLHDSTGQIVVALILNLGKLKASGSLTAEETRILLNSDGLLQTLNSELCAISYLLHPPLLDEAGLWTALEWYVQGFTQHSGIAITLERNSTFGRLNSDLEVAIFRVVQECLTNVGQHSGSSEATVRLLRLSREVRLEVQDRGKGIPLEKQSTILSQGARGVGFRGMQERVLQLGGNLIVESNSGGAMVIATFPVNETAASASNEELAVA